MTLVPMPIKPGTVTAVASSAARMWTAKAHPIQVILQVLAC